MSKVYLQKSYTRDTTLIVQQIWLEALTTGVKDKFQIEGTLCAGLDYINKGAIEVWENRENLKIIKDRLVSESNKNPERLYGLISEYERKLEEFESFWTGPVLSSTEELKFFVKTFEQWVCGDLATVFLSEAEGVNEEIAHLARNLRGKDQYFASGDSVIRKGILRIHPHLRGLEICITKDEILADKLPDVETCRRRFDNFIFTSDGYSKIEKLESYSLKNTNFIFLDESLNFEPNSELKGVVAHRGKVRGRIKVLRLVREVGDLSEGEILVSPMTTPAMVPAIKRAAGVITDEGGVLCHAAVISRELKKPCIIGTKIATKVLKDGDLVEVDAERGVVKVIEKAK